MHLANSEVPLAGWRDTFASKGDVLHIDGNIGFGFVMLRRFRLPGAEMRNAR